MANRPLDDEELSELYTRKKAHSQAPSSIKRVVMQAQASKHRRFTGLWRRTQGLAVLSALVVFFVIWESEHAARFETVPLLAGVEFHYLPAPETTASVQLAASGQIDKARAQSYEEMLFRGEIVTQHHRKQAIITEYRDGWTLETDDQRKLHLSSELVIAMQRGRRAPATLAQGDRVALGFTEEGIIIDITPR